MNGKAKKPVLNYVEGAKRRTQKWRSYFQSVSNPVLSPQSSVLFSQFAIRNPKSAIPGLWPILALLWSLLTPTIVSAQMAGSGWMISLYGMVQVEPGNGVTTLKVKDEQIRFVIQNIQCSDRNFSTGRFLSDVTHKEPGLFIKGPEEWLDLLINERPSKRVLQMRGVYYPDSRMFMLHKLERFQETPTPK